MNGHDFSSNTSDHLAAQELLPWFVTNTLNADEAALVQAHLRICAQCRNDVARQRKLRTTYLQPISLPDPGQAFSRLRQRLDVPAEADTQPKLEPRLRNGLTWNAGTRSASWMGWALAGQAGVVILLAVLLTPLAELQVYRALGMPVTATGNIVVVFKPETTMQELRQIMRDSGARMSDGPTATDAYVLTVPNNEQEQVVQALRANAAVTLAEPLGPRGAH